MRLRILLVCCAALALTVGVATATGGDGNSANAKKCQKGGWQNYFDSNDSSFASEDACVSYGAKGGTLVPGITIRDDCDPTTFNANPPVGPGLGAICTGQGTTTWTSYINQITANGLVVNGSAQGWGFRPGALQIKVGQSIRVKNVGGEAATFTKVVNFGGGFVPSLNALVGLVVPAPECFAQSVNSTIVVPGNILTVNLPVGVHRFQDCIHPWERATVTVVP